ncbi:FecR domain-containing protein [Hoeflea sp. AS60]|uniref:FecR family protein n=1 Tax=Hoeflea sp. AS60 TaxID=3135780 RepID=UPI00317836EA
MSHRFQQSRSFFIAVLASLSLAGPAIAQSVGVTSAVDPAANGTPPGSSMRTIIVGNDIAHNEQVNTDARGLVQILLLDGSTFTVGPQSSLKIDSFVYDPDAGSADLAATLGKGVFRFIGGRASKTRDGVSLKTPVGVVGIRGGIADMSFGRADGLPTHIDLVFGRSITLSRNGRRIAHLYKPGHSIVVDVNGSVHIRKTPPAFSASIQAQLSPDGKGNGGAKQKPTSSMIVSSGFAETNSEPPLSLNKPLAARRAGPQRDTAQETNNDRQRSVLFSTAIPLLP